MSLSSLVNNCFPVMVVRLLDANTGRLVLCWHRIYLKFPVAIGLNRQFEIDLCFSILCRLLEVFINYSHLKINFLIGNQA